MVFANYVQPYGPKTSCVFFISVTEDKTPSTIESGETEKESEVAAGATESNSLLT